MPRIVAAGTMVGRCALAATVLAHVALVVSVAAQPLDVNARPGGYRSPVWPLFHDAIHRRGPAADFFAVYHAGVQASRGQDPYDGREVPKRTPYFFPFRYLPGVAEVLGRPLAATTPRAAYWIWVAVMESVLFGLLLLLWRRTRARWFHVVASASLLLGTPFFLEVHMGQFTFVSAALVAMALIALAEEPVSMPAAAGAAGALAVAANLKVFPLVVAPALLRSRAGRVALLASLAALVAFNLPAVVGRPALWRSFVDLNFVHPQGGLDAGNHGLLYIVHMIVTDLGGRWSPEGWRLTATVWQVAILVGAGIPALLSRHPARIPLGGAALVIAHFLSYVHVWEHHMSGAIPIALVVLLAIASTRPRRPSIVLLVAAIALLALPTTFALQDRARNPAVWDPSSGWPAWERYLPPLCKVLPLITVFAVAQVALWRAGLSRRD